MTCSLSFPHARLLFKTSGLGAGNVCGPMASLSTKRVKITFSGNRQKEAEVTLGPIPATLLSQVHPF